jgi:hypothetical protein
VSKATIVETYKQLVGVGITQSFDAGIITTRVEMVVVPTMDVFRRGILIGCTTKLGSK